MAQPIHVHYLRKVRKTASARPPSEAFAIGTIAQPNTSFTRDNIGCPPLRPCCALRAAIGHVTCAYPAVRLPGEQARGASRSADAVIPAQAEPASEPASGASAGASSVASAGASGGASSVAAAEAGPGPAAG